MHIFKRTNTNYRIILLHLNTTGNSPTRCRAYIAWELSILDWYRFMAGWGFWGNDGWVERRARGIVESGRAAELVAASEVRKSEST